jgi:hypothetical protein
VLNSILCAVHVTMDLMRMAGVQPVVLKESNMSSKTFKQYVQDLNKFLEENPNTAEYHVIYSKDDEGNEYNRVAFDPCVCHYDDVEREVQFSDCILNAVIIN